MCCSSRTCCIPSFSSRRCSLARCSCRSRVWSVNTTADHVCLLDILYDQGIMPNVSLLLLLLLQRGLLSESP